MAESSHLFTRRYTRSATCIISLLTICTEQRSVYIRDPDGNLIELVSNPCCRLTLMPFPDCRIWSDRMLHLGKKGKVNGQAKGRMLPKAPSRSVLSWRGDALQVNSGHLGQPTSPPLAVVAAANHNFCIAESHLRLLCFSTSFADLVQLRPL